MEVTGRRGRLFGVALVQVYVISALVGPVHAGQTGTSTFLQIPSQTAPFSGTPLAATVSPIPNGGTITFTIVGPRGQTGTTDPEPLDSNGHAEVEVDFTGTGVYTVTAQYSGTSAFAASSSTSSQTDVQKELVSLTLTVLTPVIEAGDDFVAEVTLDPPAEPTVFGDATVHFALAPHGQGARYDAEIVPDSAGLATLTVPSSSLIPELWTITAWFGPTPRYAQTDDHQATFRFEPVPPLVDLVATPDPAYVGDPVTIDITVDPAPSDGGTVELFSIGPVGSDPVSMGTAPVAEDGTAQFIHSFEQNDLQMRAVFSGTATSAASQSPIYERKQLIPPIAWFTSTPNTWHPQSSATFAFTSVLPAQPAVAFECRLDSGAWASCSSPTSVGPLIDGEHTFRIRGIDANDRVGSVDEKVFHVDTGQPTVAEPDAAIVEGRLGKTLPAVINWHEAVDAVSGVANRELQRKVNSGTWQPVDGGASAVATTETLQIGSAYRYHQRASDFAENVGQWSTVLARKPVLRQEGASSIARSAGWKTKDVVGASGGRVLRASGAGAWIRTTFTGSSVGWVATMGPNMGQAGIHLDGQSTPVATVNLFKSTTSTRQIVWAHDFGSLGQHTIEIRVVGTAGHPNVDFDGLVFLGKL